LSEVQKPKPVCFVIQAFDGSTYDCRYSETIKPALVKAGVEPQRADEILGLNPVIDKIETAIESAAICVAEVSEDNPNVWLELGYALALNRPTVILCDKTKRLRLPFDIQHRPVVLYRTDSRSGFDELERDIVKFVANQLATEQRITQSLTLKPGSQRSADLEEYEVAILALAFSFWPTPVGSVSHWEVEKRLRSNSFSEVAVALGVSGLLRREYILERTVVEEDSHYESMDVKHYQITPSGISWIESHKSLLELRIAPPPRRPPFQAIKKSDDDDIPF
jgi:hypothetical protein